MPSSDLLAQVEKHVKNLLTSEALLGRPFHNFDHTSQVVGKCDELSTHYMLLDGDREALLTAAWFHDIGYLHGNINHEEESTKIASRFLNDLNVDPRFILKVNQLILATKLPAKPESLLQKILCDADLYHLASSNYSKWSDRLCREIQLQSGHSVSEAEWITNNIYFFKTHRYFTDFANTFWEKQKQNNLKTLMLLVERQ